MMKSIAVIPARYGSTRFPGKPLVDICGHPMIWWVYQNAIKVKGFSEVIIATDDTRIFDLCFKLGLNVELTKEFPTAIHRLYDISKTHKADLYVQINGDEPLINSDVIKNIFNISKKAEMSGEWGINLVSAIHNAVEVNDTSNIKVIFSEEKVCKYMSRSPVPTPFKSLEFSYYKHLGIIGYSMEMLEFYVKSVPGRLERIEGIDLLRFIDYDKLLYIVEANSIDSLSVDTEKDLEIVRERMARRIEKV